MIPDYLICADCETPCYTFEWQEGAAVEALCEVCGNDDVAGFLTEDEYDAYATDGNWRDRFRNIRSPSEPEAGGR